MADTSKITLQELEAIFEDGVLPMAAFAVLAEPGLKTPDEVRAVLREIRRQQEPRHIAKRALIGAIRSWVEQHDLKHSVACEIFSEVADSFYMYGKSGLGEK